MLQNLRLPCSVVAEVRIVECDKFHIQADEEHEKAIHMRRC